MSLKTVEYKTFEFKIDEVDEAQDEGRINGYASTFGNDASSSFFCFTNLS